MYIDEKTDYQLRADAINKNTDIVNAYLIKKVNLLWKHVLKPVFGGEDYIMRFEFQHRGSIHCHMIMSVEHGPSGGEMKLAKQSLPIFSEDKTQEQIELDKILIQKIANAREKMQEFKA